MYTATDIAEQLKRLLPPGSALRRDPDSNTHKLMLALADELARVDGRRNDAAEEMFASTVDELLPEWEKEYGLPDPCVEAAQTIPERIAALIGKVTGVGGQTPQFYIDLAGRLGINITIDELSGFQLGINGMGDPLGGAEWNHTWQVTAQANTSTAQRQQLECLFERLKPAHTRVIFEYSAALQAPLAPASITTPTGTILTDTWNVSWDASMSATTYELEESFNGGPWMPVVSTPSTVVGFSGKALGTYQYRVRACNEYGCSAYTTSTQFVRSPFQLYQAPEQNFYKAVVWSHETQQFAAVSKDGQNRIMTSPDGITWTARQSPVQAEWQSITHRPDIPRGPGRLFVAVGGNNGTNTVMTSPDGVNWTAQSAPNSTYWTSVTWADGLFLFVAVGTGAVDAVMTSPDGVNWTARQAPNNVVWNTVSWSPDLNLLVAVAQSSFRTKLVMTSPDGITWTAHNLPDSDIWKSVAWSPQLGIFVAVGINTIMTSTDGVNWVVQDAGYGGNSITWSPQLGIFVAVGAFQNSVLTSPDGVNWTPYSADPENILLSDVAWSNDLAVFVAVGDAALSYPEIVMMTF